MHAAFGIDIELGAEVAVVAPDKLVRQDFNPGMPHGEDDIAAWAQTAIRFRQFPVAPRLGDVIEVCDERHRIKTVIRKGKAREVFENLLRTQPIVGIHVDPLSIPVQELLDEAIVSPATYIETIALDLLRHIVKSVGRQRREAPEIVLEQHENAKWQRERIFYGLAS